MAIPYNPSSFNSNKTILQAIEELKKYLQENPCYKIYMYNDDYVDGTYVYDKSGVDDPDSIEAYDVIFFTNSYYSKVESVGDSTITVWPAINFTGAEGPQGPAGADGADGTNGADGVSITNVAIDGSNHLICTLSDGNTIDAGAIDESFKVYFTTITSGTLTDEEYAEMSVANVVNYNNAKYYYRYQEDATNLFFAFVDGYGVWKFGVNKSTKVLTLIIDKVVGAGVSSGTATNGQVLTANGSGGASWETPSGGAVEGTDVLSTGETSGKVLTADGTGGASWQTAGGGSSLNTYTFTTSSTPTSADIQRLCNILNQAKEIVLLESTTSASAIAYCGTYNTAYNFDLICVYGSGGYMKRFTVFANGNVSAVELKYSSGSWAITSTSSGEQFKITYKNETEILS